MAALRFTTTKLSGLRAAGRLQEMQHATVALFLERELGHEYGRLFADFEAESSDVRAWYTEAAVAPVALASLPESEAEAISQRVADMIGRIGAFAAQIAVESTQKANIARILNAATTFPMEDIWADGRQPIIVNWGFHRNDVEAGVPRPIRDRIHRASDAPIAPDAAPIPATISAAPIAAVTVSRQAWLMWLVKRRLFVLPVVLWFIFAALVASIYGMLLPACGIAGPLGLVRTDFCPLSAHTEEVFAEGTELQALVDGAELEAARERKLCPAAHHAGLRPPVNATVVVDNRL